ncbi:hypothetical protein PN836_016640 [Ningiella sp. W23]|uniref:hypothetical protein n=1 Tax=Ningiella sp. W23 TaxID=3023715 RepID=UPI0037574F66
MTYFQSTRLFPKSQGADKYEITGIASKCDWVLLSDHNPPYTYLKKITNNHKPRYIYLSLRSPFVAISEFVETVLPIVKSPFILISGSEDVTIPNQTDKRWREFSETEKSLISQILQHQQLIHWYAENLDDCSIDKLSGLPLGMVYPNNQPQRLQELPNSKNMADRELKVLCGHRVRDGSQWDIRRTVTSLAKNSWSSFTTNLPDEIPESDFLDLIQVHSFVLCAEGGGLDPSPKAWQCLLYGAIPIIKRNPANESYAVLPVVFIDEWESCAITIEKLYRWKSEYLKWFDEPSYRQELLRRLGIDYWWGKIVASS